jgi:K+-sensing histidine kinase KdpD
VHAGSSAAIVGYAAEDIMHALAELMDNATRFSAPSEEVHVYVEELHTGMVITIEDGGLGMKPQALARAEAAVSTSEPLDIAKVPGTRLGLVVVGSLARGPRDGGGPKTPRTPRETHRHRRALQRFPAGPPIHHARRDRWRG